jgi:biopolymer transport protein ExbB
MAAILGCFVFFSAATDAPAQAAEGENPPQGAEETGKLTFFELIKKGGPIMYPLGLCSLIALAIGLERAIGLRRSRIIPPRFMSDLEAAYGDNSKDNAAAIRFCEESRTPVGRIFRAGLMSLPRGDAAVEKAVEDTGGREVDRMKRSLRGLSVIASLTPLLGLLGTVYGLIGAFQETASKQYDKTANLAEGIYEALVTTAAGLTIAIPVLMVYQWLNGRTDGIVDDIDALAVEFTERHLGPSKPEGKPE